MSEGYGVDPATLDRIAGGIRDVVTELDGLGITGSGDAGLGFGGVSLSGMQLGHSGLQSALDEFADNWGWGVRGLVNGANDMAVKLGLAAGTYHDQENYAQGIMKVAANDLAGDLRSSDAEVTGSTWSQLVDHNVDQLAHPDYSVASAEAAADHAGETWQERVDDTLNSQSLGALDAAEAVRGG